MRFALLVHACVLISVCELLFTLAALEEVLEVAAVFRPTSVNIMSLSMLSVVLPLAFVIISFRRLPDAKSVLFSVFPLSFELLSIIPHILSLPMSLAVQKLA